MRGTRLLSSFLEAAKKQQPFKHHARHDKENKAYPHEGNPSAWPLEDRQSIDAMWPSKKSNNADDRFQSTTSTEISLQQGPQSVTTPAISNVGDASVLDAPMQNAEHSSIMNADGNFDTVNGNGVISDAPWWIDIFTDYDPSQSGFENPFVIEDLLPQASS